MWREVTWAVPRACKLSVGDDSGRSGAKCPFYFNLIYFCLSLLVLALLVIKSLLDFLSLFLFCLIYLYMLLVLSQGG